MAIETLGHDPLIGRTLSHYRILEKIGAGGMGEVYRAVDERLDRDVAIKVLPQGTLADESARRRFHREAIALSRINHPNVATIHEFGTEHSRDFLVMEYIPGETLSEKLQAASLAPKEVVHLGTQLVEGLIAAHEHSVIHRDLKPGNLRLSPEGRLKILDFGLAKFRQATSVDLSAETLSMEHSLIGTLPYMAPEQVLGGEMDARTDIHATGAVLYEMLTGERAFNRSGREDLFAAILKSEPRPPSEINPRVAPELERIILKCMEKEPSNRYQSAQELWIDLRRLEHSTEERIQDRKVNSIWGGTFLRKHRRVVAAVGLAIIAAIVVRYLFFAAPASIAVLPFEDLSPARDQEFLSKGLAEEILIDLSNVPDLRVAGRPSSFQIAGETGDLRVIGKKLNVANVLQGSVQRVGDRVRIRAQLFKTSDGYRLWAQSYDRDIKDIFQLEQEIGQAVADALRSKLISKEKVATQKSPPTANSEAHLAYLQARYFWHMDEEASLRKALQYASRAIELDPSFAQAYALRADIVQDLGGMAWMDITEAITESHSDAQKAIELAPNLPDGYRALSTIRARTDSNCPAAQELLKKARALAPANPDTLALSAQNAVCLGQLEEAVSLYGETLAIDPLRLSEYMFKAQVLRDLGRYEEADVELNKALELNPRNPWLVHETRGEVYMLQGRLQEALAEMEKEPAGYAHEIGMALVHQALGQRADSDAALNELLTRYPNETAYQIAQVYAYRGEVDQAFDWLDRAHRQHDPGLMWLKTDWKMKAVRNDPRYQEMLKKLHLAD